MGVSVFLSSWFPLVVALVGDTVGPFVFQFWASLTLSAVWFLCLLWAHPTLAGRWDMWAWAVRQLRTRDGVLATLNGFNGALFIWAALLLETAVVPVITAGWLMLFVAYQRRHDSRYRRMGLRDWLLMAVAMAGVALVILSQTGDITTDGGWQLFCGVLLAAASAVCTAQISCRFKLGKHLYDQYRDAAAPDNRKDELACVLAVSVVAQMPSLVGSLLLGLTLFPAKAEPAAYLAGFVSAPIMWVVVSELIGAFGSVAFRYANLQAANLGVNAMMYLQPVLSLVWLATFSTIAVHRTDFLWVGAAAVIGANVLINFRAVTRPYGEGRAIRPAGNRRGR